MSEFSDEDVGLTAQKLQNGLADEDVGITPTLPSSGVTIAPEGGAPREASSLPTFSNSDPGTLLPSKAYLMDKALPSAGDLAWNTVSPFLHPLETGKQLGQVARGTYDYFSGNETPEAKQAEAVGNFYKDRYGSLNAIENTAYNDPFGFAADVSVPFTLGGSGLERLPGLAGKIGEVASTVGRIDPITAGVNVVKNIGAGTGRVAADILGSNLGTGAGGQTLVEAAKAGAQVAKGNLDPFKAFQQNALRQVDPASVVGQAKDAVNNMRLARSDEYTKNMTALGKNPTPLSFNDIDTALSNANKVKTFTGSAGPQNLSPSTSAIRQTLQDTVDNWRNLPQDYHTAAGFDALKQQVGDILGQTKFGTPEHNVAQGIYGAIKNTIIKQDPAYANYMKSYSAASDQIHDMESTLSLNPKARIDTQLRKLQSVMRNNVNTNYSQRLSLADQLEQNGATNLKASLAGQASNIPAPRGLPIGGGANLIAQAAMYGLTGFHPMNLLALAAHSPFVMGQGAALGGILGGALGRLPLAEAGRAAFQTRSLPQQQ